MVRKSRTPRRTGLTAKLAQASWAEADRALAQAWADFAELAGSVRRGPDMFALVEQSLSRAARQRGLMRVGAAGEIAPYDPLVHELVVPRKRAPPVIEVVAPGVSRADKVLLKARVKPVRSAS